MMSPSENDNATSGSVIFYIDFSTAATTCNGICFQEGGPCSTSYTLNNYSLVEITPKIYYSKPVILRSGKLVALWCDYYNRYLNWQPMEHRIIKNKKYSFRVFNRLSINRGRHWDRKLRS